MDAVIVNYRGSKRTQKGNQMVVLIPSVDSLDKAKKLLGKQVVWTSPGKLKKQIKGKVSSTHGNGGAVRVIFETGMPGQALGQKVVIE
ncbi:MAG TPA: 50S ribosomal protein L35ae [Candidatus Nanoarchaeia archaeon]|nr:50S ribosomal protein L35ae [Candidatus Nanoarchaeia archaeon]